MSDTMKHELIEAGGKISNAHLENWKSAGKKVIGYTCSYLPEEIVYAADILPYRMRGIETESSTIGDTYFGPFICSFPKCLLQLVGVGRYKFLDGAVIVPGCDSMRRIDECWRKCGEDVDGIVPEFFYHYGVPHKAADYSLDFFVEETRNLIGAMEKHFRVKITEEKLRKAIGTFNEGRRMLHKFEEIRKQDPPVISGADALSVHIAGKAIPREIYNSLLKDFLEELEKSGTAMANRKRLMLVGSANDDIELLRVLEGERGIIVTDTLCFGPRHESDLVDEEGDPIRALAKRYLNNLTCPRMFGEYKTRLKMLEKKIEEARIDGVILQNIRFCDLHGSENGLFERALEEKGIPTIRLEREYGPLVESGRIRMRIDAFMERLEA